MSESDMGMDMMEQAEDTTDLSTNAIPVVITGSTESDAPAFGSLQTFPVVATSPPQQILAQNDRRRSGRVLVFAGTGAAVGAFVRVGTRAQIMNGQGGQLLAGTNLEIRASQEQWLGSDGTNTMIVTVLDERFA